MIRATIRRFGEWLVRLTWEPTMVPIWDAVDIHTVSIDGVTHLVMQVEGPPFAVWSAQRRAGDQSIRCTPARVLPKLELVGRDEWAVNEERRGAEQLNLPCTYHLDSRPRLMDEPDLHSIYTK